MSKAVVVRDQQSVAVQPSLQFTRDQIDLIKRTVAKGATDDELKLFLYQAEKKRLDPLSRQIYFQKRRTKNGDTITILTAIDGYRLIADRTGLYAGNDDPVFDDEDSPRKATVTVYKLVKGVRCGFTATARWDQYYPGDMQGFMWRKMPHLMLGKCAEGLALRKAFPEELSGVLVKEEMDQADSYSSVVEDDSVMDAPAAEPVVEAPTEEEIPEKYRATKPQKARLMGIAKAQGITDVEALKALSELCMGLEIEHLEAAVSEWKADHK